MIDLFEYFQGRRHHRWDGYGRAGVGARTHGGAGCVLACPRPRGGRARCACAALAGVPAATRWHQVTDHGTTTAAAAAAAAAAAPSPALATPSEKATPTSARKAPQRCRTYEGTALVATATAAALLLLPAVVSLCPAA